jgi:hypothetical protein
VRVRIIGRVYNEISEDCSSECQGPPWVRPSADSALRRTIVGLAASLNSNLSALQLALFGLEDRAQVRWNRICRRAPAQRGGLAEERSG